MPTKRTPEKILTIQSPYERPHADDLVIQVLLQCGHQVQCQQCLVSTWCGEPIVPKLYRMNGNRRDSTPGNLRILCANCKSQALDGVITVS